VIWLIICALLAGGVQAYFAFLELRRWGVPFVDEQTRGWDKPLNTWLRHRGEPNEQRPALATVEPEPTLAELKLICVEWAQPLATNLGVYNLLVALALLWTAIAGWVGAASAVPLALMLGLFLVGAGLAAGATGVPRAFIAQSALGLALLVTAALARGG
jgi:uncharacterized membrane protein